MSYVLVFVNQRHSLRWTQTVRVTFFSSMSSLAQHMSPTTFSTSYSIYVPTEWWGSIIEWIHLVNEDPHHCALNGKPVPFKSPQTCYFVFSSHLLFSIKTCRRRGQFWNVSIIYHLCHSFNFVIIFHISPNSMCLLFPFLTSTAPIDPLSEIVEWFHCFKLREWNRSTISLYGSIGARVWCDS